MKKLFILCMLAFAVGACQDIAQNSSDATIDESIDTRAPEPGSPDYYWLSGEKIPLRKLDNKFYVMYEPENESRLKAELSKTGAAHVDARVNTYTTKNTKLPTLKAVTVDGNYEKVKDVLSQAYYWAPYYRTRLGDGQLGNQFMIKLKDEADLPLLEKLAKENSVEFLGEHQYGWYKLACTNLSAGNSLEMANLFYETGMFMSVSYDLGARGKLACINEPLFYSGGLWHLGNSSSPFHINYCNARTLVPQASSNVKIAIIDSGVDIHHTDLYNVLTGWDAETRYFPNYTSNPHGTFVAGFIAATPNNGNDVAGIAYGATILPISFRVAPPPSNYITSSAETIEWAIDKAVQEGAKIINCSWHYDENIVEEAIVRALDSGCIVVFASGNDGNNYLTSPANSDPRILTVGSISSDGKRSSFSCYGEDLDVVAPGEAVYSTTLGGGSGFSSGGTSYAAPQVSAIAALILSADPSLSRQEVVDIIERSSRKVSHGAADPSYNMTYDYHPESGRGNGAWDERMGYGLVDAYGAIASLYLGNTTVAGPDSVIVGAEAIYSVPAPWFDGWSVTPNNSSMFHFVGMNNLTPTTRIVFTQPGNFTVSANFSVSNVPITLSKNVTAVPAPESTISGPSQAMVNISEEYSVPAPPSGVTFNGWSINPATYITTGGTSNRTLNITFTATGQHTLTANFTLQGSIPYSISKSVYVAPQPPIISADDYYVKVGDSFTVSVHNPLQPWFPYMWEMTVSDGSTSSTSYDGDTSWWTVPTTIGHLGKTITLKCRDMFNELWSNEVVIQVTPSGINPIESPTLLTPVISKVVYLPPIGLGLPRTLTYASVDNPQIGVTYEWEINGTIQSGNKSYLDVIFFSPLQNIKCRAWRGNEVSAWSNILTHGGSI